MRRARFVAASSLILPVLLLAAGCATTPGAGAKAATRPAANQYQDPTAKTLYAMARVLQSQGKMLQAEFVLLRLVKEFGTFVPAYSDLAGLRAQQGRYDEAVELLNAASKMAPDDPVLLNNTGICLLMKGNVQGALDCFEKASARDLNSARYRANQALALGMLQRDQESLDLYKQVVNATDSEHNVDLIKSLRTGADQEAEQAPGDDAERVAAQQEAEQDPAEEAARVAAQQEAEQKAEEAARVAAQQEAERKAAEEAARVAAQQEAERKAAEDAARVAAQQEAERKAAEEAARVAAQQEAEQKAAEEAARVAAQQEADRQAAEAARLAARQVAQQLAAQNAAEEHAGQTAADGETATQNGLPTPAAPDSPVPPAENSGQPNAAMSVVDAEPAG